MVSMSGKAPRLGIVATLLVAAVLAMAGPQPARAQTPPRITGRYVVIESTPLDSTSPTQAVASCDPGDQILGGGGGAFAIDEDFAEIQRRLEITRMAPFGVNPPSPSHPHGLEVVAAETAQGTDGAWYVSARAICARNLVAGHQIVRSETTFGSPSSRTTESECPSGKSAIGSGAEVHFFPGQPDGGVGFTVIRPFATGDIVRAKAVERPGGYPFEWGMSSYAICATTPLGYNVVESRSSGPSANANCPAGTQILDGGGRADTTLRVAIPFTTVDEAAADAPRYASSGLIAAYATCATTTPG
jgi:hypothetical protein